MKNGCPNLASKLLKPNGQMERMVKMTKKDQGERGLGGGGGGGESITPTRSKTVHGN